MGKYYRPTEALPRTRAQSSVWWKIGMLGGLIFGFLAGVRVGAEAQIGITADQATIVALQENLGKYQASLKTCREISQSNYQVASAAQVENAKLRALVVEYQAQIQRGQLPAELSGLLLKLLIK